jgi:hypothetical protein
MDTTQTENMLTEDCLTFLNSILAQLKDPHSKNLLDILKAAKGRLFTRNLSDEEKKKGLAEHIPGSAIRPSIFTSANPSMRRIRIC